MDENLKIFINGIKDKTGLQIAVFNPEGVCVAGVGGVSETVDRNIEGFLSDTVNGRTLFSLTFKNKK